MDGYTTKKESLEEIAKEEVPDIITINDTALNGKMKVKIPNYFSYSKNREKKKGGVATVIADYLKPNTLKVGEGREGDEYIITRFDTTNPAINVINIYGQQETKNDKDDIEKSWLRLLEDVKDIENRNESILIIGDMNRSVGNDKWGIRGSKETISNGGHLIRNLLQTELYVLINNLDIVQGGPWTWIDRQDSNRRSSLDLGIISASLIPFISKVIIDVDRKFTPRRVIKRKKGSRSIFTDHYSLKLELSGIPRNRKQDEIESTWNRGKPGGWEVYKRLTDEVADKIVEIIEDVTKDIDTVEEEINRIDTKVKFKAFGKTKRKKKVFNKSREEKECRCRNEGSCKRCKTQEEKDDELLRKQSQRIEQKVEEIKGKKQGRAGNVFQMRKEIAGPKKAGQEATAIKDPKTGEMIVTKEDIKKATLQYCVENLRPNEPDEEVKDMVENRKKEQLMKMNDKDGETFEVKPDDFQEVLEKFEKKDTTTYDYLIKAGERYKYAMYKYCKRIIDSEEIPESFKRTILYMLWKMKGQPNVLKQNRFLHMKQVLVRTVDSLVVAKMKEPLVSSSSIFQVGGLPGHSIMEHLLSFKTILARMEEIGEGLIFFFVDIVSFFDREDIYDCLETLEEIKVNKKARRMWYLLNKDTRIVVKTAFGTTEEAYVGDCLAQGTSGAGLISAANLDRGLQKFFNKKEDEDEDDDQNGIMKYGKVRIQPMAYQDDIGSPCLNVEMVRMQARKMKRMLQEKNLEAHPEKSGIIIVGSKSFKEKVKKEILENPIEFHNFKLDVKIKEKYLGQMIESNLASSALATVKERAGKIKGAAMEVKSIVEDFQMQAMGGLTAAWELWEKALLPSLLSGAGTWLGNIKETENLCNSLQNFYWRVILKVPESCPKLALLCETKMLDMKWRIWDAKCNRLVKTQCLDDEALAKQIYFEAETNNWPGLGREVRQICKQIHIQDLNKYNVRKSEIKDAILRSHYQDMMGRFEGSKKLQNIRYDDFTEIQPYFQDKSIENARLKFRIRSQMVDKIPGNFKNKYRFDVNGLKCFYCPQELTQSHCISCPGRLEMRKDLNMTNFDDIVVYFKRFLSDENKMTMKGSGVSGDQAG